MPIIVKDFKWRQTVNTLIIQVPLNGVHQSKANVFTTPKYVKASYAPYFFEAFLSRPISTSQSTCTLLSKEIVFELRKEEPCHWENLELSLSKQEKNHLKKLLIGEEHQRFQKECEEKLAKKDELKKIAVREQISLDTKQRERIEHLKSTEKEKALGDVYSWQKNVEPNHKKIELVYNSSEDEEKKAMPKLMILQKKSIPRYNLKKIDKIVSVPLPRTTATLEVKFTERELPTPSRESRLEEENEWLRKQAEVRRSAGFTSEDLKPEEKNPQYLKAKGDEFLKVRNYLAAISAYSFGIKLSEKYSELYVKRSEAHFLVGNMQRTIHDCSTALELMKPEVPANFLDRVTCIYRRGKALFNFGMRAQGFSEVEIAYKMQPCNEEIRQTLVEFMNEMNKINENSDEACN